MSRSCRGFTLIELVTAAAVMGVVMAAIAATLTLAGRALPRAGDQDPHDVLESFAEDLLLAQQINEIDSRAIEFMIADRTGDREPETIRLSWDGAAGSGLMLSENGGPPRTLLRGVASFEVSAETVDTIIEEAGPESLGDERLLAVHSEAAPGNFAVTGTAHVGQVFRPKLPPGATGYVVTRARVHGSTSGNGIFAVELRTVDALDHPSTTIIASAALEPSGAGNSARWHEASFAPTATRTGSLALVLRRASGSGTWSIGRVSEDAADRDAQIVTTSNSGGSWSSDSDGAILHEVYGRFMVPTIVTRIQRRVTAITLAITLQSQSRPVEIVVRPLTSPEGP